MGQAFKSQRPRNCLELMSLAYLGHPTLGSSLKSRLFTLLQWRGWSRIKADKIFTGEAFPGSVIKGLTALAVYSAEPWEGGELQHFLCSSCEPRAVPVALHMPLDLVLSSVHPIIQSLKLRVRTCPGVHGHGPCTASYLAHPLLIRKQQCGHVSEDTGDVKHHGMFIKPMNVVIIYVRLDSHVGFLTLSAKRLAPTLSVALYAVFCCPILEP